MNAQFDAGAVENIIGYVFKDKSLLRRCFTHSSYANEHGVKDNERLEFFGDTVVKFIQTEYLFTETGGSEGAMTLSRQRLESNEFLRETVKKLGLDKFVLLGNGQAKNAHRDEKLFSSVYEALVAGIYLDGGLGAAKNFVTETVLSEMQSAAESGKRGVPEKDYKTALQEYALKSGAGAVGYKILSKTGAEHAPEFTAAVIVRGNTLATGKGRSKKQAESLAAKDALDILLKQDGTNCEL